MKRSALCLIALFIPVPAVAGGTQDLVASCTVDPMPPIWQESLDLRKQLSDDAFADVYDVYISDIGTIHAEIEARRASLTRIINNECRTAITAGQHYNAHCAGTLTEAEAVACRDELVQARQLAAAVFGLIDAK